MSRQRAAICAAVLVALTTLACAGDHSTGVDKSPLEGLAKAAATDSLGNPLPKHDTASATPGSPGGGVDTSVVPTPGYFRGTVRSSEMVQGTDTLGGSVRIANVKVDAYARLANGDAGALAATVTSDAQGEWQLPVLAAGNYIVTFTPP